MTKKAWRYIDESKEPRFTTAIGKHHRMTTFGIHFHATLACMRDAQTETKSQTDSHAHCLITESQATVVVVVPCAAAAADDDGDSKS